MPLAVPLFVTLKSEANLINNFKDLHAILTNDFSVSGGLDSGCLALILLYFKWVSPKGEVRFGDVTGARLRAVKVWFLFIFILWTAGSHVGCSENRPPKDPEIGSPTEPLPQDEDDPKFKYQKITQRVGCGQETFRLEFRGSVLFIFDSTDNIVSIIDISDKEKNGVWNHILSLFNMSRNPQPRATDVLNWTGVDGLSPEYDHASIFTGNKIGRAIYTAVQPLTNKLVDYRVDNPHASLHSLAGRRQLNEGLRRLANMIPTAGYFINKMFAQDDGAVQVSIGKALKQLELVMIENSDLVSFLGGKTRNAEKLRKIFRASIHRILVEASTPNPLKNMLFPKSSERIYENFLAKVEKRRKTFFTKTEGNWYKRDLYSLIGNMLGGPEHAFIGILIDGHAAHIDGVVNGYLMEEALLQRSSAAYEKARMTLSSRALIPFHEEVMRNIGTATRAVRQFACTSYEQFYNLLSDSQKTELADARKIADQLVYEMERRWGNFHDGVLGNLVEAENAFARAHFLQKHGEVAKFGLFDANESGRKFTKALKSAHDAMKGLARSAEKVEHLWNVISSSQTSFSIQREKFKLGFLLQEWAVVNSQVNDFINRLYHEEPILLAAGGFADGGLTDYNRIIFDIRSGVAHQHAQTYMHVNNLILNGGTKIQKLLNKMHVGLDVPLRYLEKVAAEEDLQKGRFTYRRVVKDNKTNTVVKSDVVVISPDFAVY